jgi:uncharacterized protein (DUF433 family)
VNAHVARTAATLCRVIVREPSSRRGAYTAERASALSGVPLSTIRYWANHGILVPAVWDERPLLWSYSDLVGLRTIHWLRKQKTLADGAEIPAATMPAVRDAIRELGHLTWGARAAYGISVDAAGRLYFRKSANEPFAMGNGQMPGPWLDLLAPFEIAPGVQAPDLRRPRPTLRIEPAKLTGAPHVAGTRVETLALFALQSRGLDANEIRQLYPFLHAEAIQDAVQFEEQLASNLKHAA